MEPNAQRPDHDGETFLASPIAVVGPAAARSLGGGGRRFLLEEEEEAEKNFPYGRVMLKIPRPWPPQVYVLGQGNLQPDFLTFQLFLAS